MKKVHPLIRGFRAFVEREQLFSPGDKLLLACSAGLDSTVLAHVLKAEGYDFAIAHMNFQLRGAASDGDAQFVKDLAGTLDAKVWVRAVDLKAAAEAGESTQMTARRLRYEWFKELIRRGPRNRLVTAHHAEDNLETTLINLIRGTGIRGLAGIDPHYRPLLECGREDIRDYAAVNDIRWREDASNASDDYLRNRVRHRLTPVLRELGMTTEGWVKTAANLRSASDLHRRYLSELRERHAERRENLWVVCREEALEEAQVLTAFLHEYVVDTYGFTAEQVRQIVSLPGQRSLESETSVVYVQPHQLTFAHKTDSMFGMLRPRKVLIFPNRYRDGYFDLTIDLIPRPAELNEAGVHYLTPPVSPDGTYLPLHLRPRQNGDRFQPLGLKGQTKKVKDFLIDEKVPPWLRDRIYLLTDADGEILAIPGLCISERGKVRVGEPRVLRIKWR